MEDCIPELDALQLEYILDNTTCGERLRRKCLLRLIKWQPLSRRLSGYVLLFRKYTPEIIALTDSSRRRFPPEPSEADNTSSKTPSRLKPWKSLKIDDTGLRTPSVSNPLKGLKVDDIGSQTASELNPFPDLRAINTDPKILFEPKPFN